eukprot:s2093_g12.t1
MQFLVECGQLMNGQQLYLQALSFDFSKMERPFCFKKVKLPDVCGNLDHLKGDWKTGDGATTECLQELQALLGPLKEQQRLENENKELKNKNGQLENQIEVVQNLLHEENQASKQIKMSIKGCMCKSATVNSSSIRASIFVLVRLAGTLMRRSSQRVPVPGALCVASQRSPPTKTSPSPKLRWGSFSLGRSTEGLASKISTEAK